MQPRESSFRNIYGEVHRKEVSYTDVKVNKSAAQLIKANTTLYAVPWSTSGGSLGVFPINKPGKIVNPALIRGHASTILAFDFSPFIETFVATGSRDPEVKLWQVPAGGLTQDIKDPLLTLNGHTKRITAINFHPTANNILLSTSADYTGRIWDVTKGESALELAGHGDVLLGAEWSVGGQLLTACQDAKYRLYDIRTGKDPVVTQVAHEGTKGFHVSWLGNSAAATDAKKARPQFFATVGFSKSSERQLAIWDTRKPNQPATVQVVDVSSSSLQPFYDPDIGLLYLVEKGTKTYVYEMTSSDPYAYLCAKYEAKSTQSGATILPKRMMNVMNCEVARFMTVGNDVIDTVSFFVPRKDKSLFQEDLFPPTQSGEPAMSSRELLEGKIAPPVLKSIRPANVKSVYEVSEEAGGRSLVKDQLRAANNDKGGAKSSANAGTGKIEQLSEGTLMIASAGFLWTSWSNVFVALKGKTFYVFEDQAAAVPLHSIHLSNLSEIKGSDDELIMELISTGKPPLKLKCHTVTEKESWKLSFVEAKKKAMQDTKEPATVGGGFVSPQSGSAAPAPSGSPSQTAAPTLQGYLLKFTEGFFYNSWAKQYFKVADNVLHCLASESQTESAEQVLLEKVTSVYEATNIDNAPNCFKVSTATRTWTLRANSPEELNHWITTLDGMIKALRALRGDNGDDEFVSPDSGNTNVVEGWLSVKTSIWSLWSRNWVSSVGSDILLFKQPTAPQPLKRIPMGSVTVIEISDKDIELAFLVRCLDGTNYHFLAASREERDEWMRAVHEMKVNSMGSVDVLESFKIDMAELAKQQSRLIEDALKNNIDLTKVKAGQQPILIRIYGKRYVRSVSVEPSWKNLHIDGVFILDKGTHIYQWNGSKASRMQRAKAMDIVTRIKQKERGGGATVVLIDQNSKEDNDTKISGGFWSAIGGIHEIKTEIGNEAADRDEIPVKLYRVTDKKVYLMHQGRPPSKDRLNPKFVYVAECGPELFLWNGKLSSKEAKKLGLKVLEKLQQSKSGWTSILRLVENGEVVLWKEKFRDYPGELPISMQKQTIVSNVTGRKEQKPIDIAKMHAGITSDEIVVDDDGRGRLEVWKVEDFGQKVVPKEMFGQLFASSSFLLKYTYGEDGNEKIIIYFWQGRDSSINEKGTSAYLTKEMDDKLAGTAKQIRIPQDFESKHFRSIFKGKLAFHLGPYKQDWANVTSARMYDIRGNTAADVTAKEVQPACGSLNGSHVFVVIGATKIFIWQGKFANEFEKAFATPFAQSFVANRSVESIKEGSETEEFWKAIGGSKSEYFSPKKSRVKPKLFMVSDASGAVECDEIYEIAQDSLRALECHILDAQDVVYVWFGPQCTVREQKWSMQTAKQYVQQSKTHAPDTPIFVTKMFQEPIGFKAQFQAWSNSKFPKEKTTAPVYQTPLDQILGDYLRDVYSYSELLADPLPVGVDATNLEIYLTTDEFTKVFSMTRDEYDKLPKWKQTSLKEKVGLF